MPTWFPWIIVGGVIFILLSLLGSKLKEKPYRSQQYLQDFISGSIMVALLGTLAPDLFPSMKDWFDVPASLSSSDDDVLIQLGPLSHIRR